MQLSAAAALAALVALAAPARAEDVRVAADTLIYVDDDHVTVVTPQASAAVALDDDGGEVAARAVVDVVSAASVDVVSHATPSFQETRVGGELAAQKRLGDWRPGARLALSIEPDYHSYGGGLFAERRLAGPDTVLRVAWNGLWDRIGRSGTSFDVWSRALTTQALDVGLTQTLDPRTVGRVTYTLVLQDGEMAKPYRYVPLFDQAGLDRAAADGVRLDLATFDAYRLPERPPEAVPSRRLRHALGLRLVRWLGVLALHIDERLYADSWGLLASTTDVELAWPVSPAVTVRAGYRLHAQGSVDFWQRTYVVEAGVLPRHRSLDRELSASLSQTPSLGVTWRAGGLSAYTQAAAMHSRWDELLLLDERWALLVQLGLRYTP